MTRSGRIVVSYPDGKSGGGGGGGGGGGKPPIFPSGYETSRIGFVLGVWLPS